MFAWQAASLPSDVGTWCGDLARGPGVGQDRGAVPQRGHGSRAVAPDGPLQTPETQKGAEKVPLCHPPSSGDAGVDLSPEGSHRDSPSCRLPVPGQSCSDIPAHPGVFPAPL